MRSKIFFLLLLFSFSHSLSFIKIGHRGACGYEPENTLRSFLKALELGCDMVELDVHLCASGELVVIHDETVDRTTNGTGFVSEKTCDELKTFDAGKGECIPTLREVLDAVDRRMKINIELKGRGTADSVVQLIKEYVQEKNWNYGDFLVTSFDHYALQKISKANAKIPLGILVYCASICADHMARAVGACCVVVNHKVVHKKFVDDLHAQGLSVFVFSINDPDGVVNAQNCAVDGIISDVPDIL